MLIKLFLFLQNLQIRLFGSILILMISILCQRCCCFILLLQQVLFSFGDALSDCLMLCMQFFLRCQFTLQFVTLGFEYFNHLVTLRPLLLYFVFDSILKSFDDSGGIRAQPPNFECPTQRLHPIGLEACHDFDTEITLQSQMDQMCHIIPLY